MLNENRPQWGLIGLGVMGENLSLNIASKGFPICVYDRTPAVLDKFLSGRGKGLNICGAKTLEELVQSLSTPRIVMMMIKAGTPVDETIEKLIPLLSKGDVIIDGGNSHFEDSIKRTKKCENVGILFVGTGVSGGEEGALKGPSIMPGGSKEAWPLVKPVLQAISAKVDGIPCCDWVGSNGAGHFVKMIHNGIEYGDMQLICEAYQIMKDYLGMTADEISEVFKEWNKGVLDSYLIEITADILSFKDKDGSAIVDKILDTAGQKGTGKWTSISALHEGIPLTLISEAVFARCLSALKEERMKASEILVGETPDKNDIKDKIKFIEGIRKALYASKIISYSQGFSLLRAASKTYDWNLNLGGIAMLWRGGCIIRSKFLINIKEAFDKNADLENLLLDPFFTNALATSQKDFRKIVSASLLAGIPIPAFASALTYYDGYRNKRLPANLLQAQRDYFGAHTYERIDKPRGEFFHTDWTGEGGKTTSGTYTV